jgi:hypothetical protein
MTATETIPHALGLRAGDLVEVRSEQEILSTLDSNGRLDRLPFMPEMLQFCGRRVRVFRRADKTCDTIGKPVSRRMTNAVHLEALRCDGSNHGGCQAGCLLFWKEAWLKPVPNGTDGARPSTGPSVAAGLTREALAATTIRHDPSPELDGAFVCQATELPRATTPLTWWDPRQYLRELFSGNVSLWTWIRVLAIALFNAIQRRRGGRLYPHATEGMLQQTPNRPLDLQPGDRARIRSRDEILATLDSRQRNRGLWFDMEMVPYCGGEYRVLRRVEQIINERTGRMIRLPGECLILEDVVCSGCYSRERLFCPRSIYPFWREVWLERAK